jgi:hypothetical protein
LEAVKDESWGEDFAWLVKSDGSISSIEECSSAFINKNRRELQSPCTPESAILFSEASNVNTWTAVWWSDGKLNYLYSDQGQSR